MRPRRRLTSAAAKGLLLAGAAIATLCASAAQAREQTPRPAASPDELQPDELYMEADKVTHDEQNRTTTAEGSVEIRYQGQVLRADRVIYREGTEGEQGVIRALGHVQIVNPDGSVQYADQFVLDDKMRAGVAQGFSARLQENIKIAGATAVRRSETVQELNRAIYTPCPVCAANHAKRPTWSISAERVVQDKRRRVVYYRNARIHVLGAPILYFPVFWHADPSAPRASGFLAPRIQASDRRGFSYEQPYLFAFSPYADLVLSPQLNTRVNPFLNAEYRRRFYSGDLDVRFGYTHDRDFDGRGQKFGADTNRSYVLAHGGFQVTDVWRWGFTAERTSDLLLFDKYQIGDVFLTRGPYTPDDRRLISQIYAVRQDRQSYISTAAFDIQGLRQGDVDRTFPLVAPLIESRFDIPGQVLGGRLRVRASAAALTRDQSPVDLAARLPGIDSRRATGEVDWRTSFTSAAGLRVEPFVQARVDAYSLDDLLTGVADQTTSKSLARGLGVVGADVSYPLYRRWGNATVIVEPVAQAAISPDANQVVVGRDAQGAPVFLNEDSVALEFDETTLVRANKFPGFDLYEDGARLSVAGRGAILWDDGRRANLLIGRSFRSERNTVFSPRTGLQQRASDWIVAGDAQPISGLSFFARARLDSDNFELHRAEAGANLNNRLGSGFIRYLRDDSGLNGQPIENLDLGGDVPLTRNWGVTLYGNRDLTQKAWVIRDVGVYYRDDCTRMDVIYRREDTVIGRLGPRDSIAVRLTLATLGAPFAVQ